MSGHKIVDYKLAVLITAISHTDVDNVTSHIKAGTQILVNTDRDIGCDGKAHFEIFPHQYRIEQKYAC